MQIRPEPALGPQGIGRQIRQSRKALGLRQDELAVAAGVSTRAIHQLEHGKPTSRLDTLGRVLDVLGLELTVTERSPRPPAEPEGPR